MNDVDLTTTIGNVIKLANPFWIASSHFSENQSMIERWHEIEPAALTLKTCTRKDRIETKRSIRTKTAHLVPRYGRSYYCDGPKSKELKSYEENKDLLQKAKRLLKTTKIGTSLLASKEEDYDQLHDMCSESDFIELNLKYSFRGAAGDESFFGVQANKWQETIGLVKAFLKSFADKPVFVKISRELDWLPGTKEATELVCLLREHKKAGLIIANSQKLDIGDFIYENEETSLRGGVITGEALFDGTLKIIEGMRDLCVSQSVPIVATGGMVDEQQVLMALRSGADAVQLCTAFDYNGVTFYQTLVSALKARIKWRGLSEFPTFLERLRQEGIASVYSMPFFYARTFWSDEIQKQLQQDIRFSERMDVVVMSGRTLLDRWAPLIRDRISKKFYSLRMYLLNPDSAASSVIQQSWGLLEAKRQDRKERVSSTKLELQQLFDSGRVDLAKYLEEELVRRVEKGMQEISADVLRSAQSGKDDVLLALRKENKRLRPFGEDTLPEPSWEVMFHDQCPFFSVYMFDDKVYLAQYPFLRPNELASPVYVFFRSSPEYDRIENEVKGLREHIRQTLLPPAVGPVESVAVPSETVADPAKT